jgi:L-alanine-DL-glutamate epimerase-like enolase superfamily enzyme
MPIRPRRGRSRMSSSPVVKGRNPRAVNGAWQATVWAIRNHGRPGVVFMAISAVDNTLWDLKAPLLNLPLFLLLGAVRESMVVGKSDGTAHGGHIVEAHVWPILELIITESPRHLHRFLDQETGLALIRV